ncbi:DUF2891 domain-containing protein [Hirschia baltica]|uniref:DUF2891 domain-containing protein n=1 Tax=Hirschia baltica (strain ATCC 49814 / DSM 5838 / IFAM 1418) TaxID=582402 RepID=C6XL48_HIRBI|nr:DUF2891 domain-containing protein [Hirschia baltica]ACT57877.1 conserved hypothetical protein [Hirschia baltica ATCC 49814]
MKHLYNSLFGSCAITIALILSACSAEEQAPEFSGTPVTETPTEASTTKAISLPSPREGVVEDRFALLALTCLDQKYPNKISVVLNNDTDAKTPADLFPSFYGCFDWHSSVHGHWLLARILNTDPDTPMREAIEHKVGINLSAEKLAGEVAYFQTNGKGAFERPYGRAWLLQLAAELEESDLDIMQQWRENLRPLENVIVEQTQEWLGKLAYPIRIGTHNQSAFAFGLMIDYARTVENTAFETQLVEAALKFHKDDTACPLAYEPSGEDFLSPCLMEADLMRRVMPQEAYVNWLTEFLPDIPTDGSDNWLKPGIVLDATDGKLVHLDGVNLSRAWALEGIASALPENDARIASLLASSALHRETGIAAVSAEHYSGSHWLGSFATYLTTKRGISNTTITE